MSTSGATASMKSTWIRAPGGASALKFCSLDGLNAFDFQESEDLDGGASGLNLVGNCTNVQCIMHDRIASSPRVRGEIMALGNFGRFEMAKITLDFRCYHCKEIIGEVNCYVRNCKWRYSGVVIDSVAGYIQKEGKGFAPEDGRCYQFTGNEVEWRLLYLDIFPVDDAGYRW